MFDPFSIRDPRLDPDFEASHWPLCDGATGPEPGSTNRTEQRKIQFLALYYRLNKLYAELSAVREGNACDERESLGSIQRAIHERDALEDFYQAEGFLGEPVMEGTRYANVEFMHAKRRQVYQSVKASSFSLFIPLPPPGADAERWVRHHLSLAMFGRPDDPEAETQPAS